MRSFLFFSLRLSASAVILFSAAQGQPKREFRGTWVATVANLDWPSSPGDLPDNQRSQLVALFDQLKSAGINTIVFQVRPECDALYKSALEPWSYYLTGKQGRPPSDPNFDPLQFAVDEAHKRGMELHAWFNPYRAVRSIGLFTIDTTHVSVRHPNWILTFNSTKLKILDPGVPQVREYVSRVVADIVRRYDVDGVHADDYFYPYDPIISNEDDATFAAYSRGFTNRGDWRRDNVNLLMKQLSDSIKVIKPFVKFGMSPFGIWKNGVPPGITGLDAYNAIYGDAMAWLNQGTVDYLAPQLYWPFGGGQDYAKLMPWWADSTTAHNRHLYIGQGAYRISTWSAIEMPNQLRANRANGKVQGSLYFRANNGIIDNLRGFADSLKENFYRYLSLLPVMAWKDVVAPYPPRAIRYASLPSTGRPAIQWDLPLTAPDGDSASRYAVYRFDHTPVLTGELADPRNMISVEGQRFSVPVTQRSAGPYYYVVTALDRNYNESDTSNVLMISAPPVPILASPVSGTSSVPESVAVVWRSSALAFSYVLQISTDPSFLSGMIVNDSTLVDTARVVRGLTGQAMHYWRVKAANAGGSSAYSSTSNFTTGFPLAATLLVPPNVQPDVVTNPTFVWMRSAAATSYRFQLAKSENFASVLVDTSGLADTTFSVSQLQSYTIYFWRVKASNSVGISDWSTVFRFRTAQSTAVAELPTDYSLSQNYPNPFNPVTTIQFALPVPGHVVLRIYDVLGREVATLIDEELPAGRHSVPWDASNKANGVYFAHMLSGYFAETRRMLLIK